MMAPSPSNSSPGVALSSAAGTLLGSGGGPGGGGVGACARDPPTHPSRPATQLLDGLLLAVPIQHHQVCGATPTGTRPPSALRYAREAPLLFRSSVTALQLGANIHSSNPRYQYSAASLPAAVLLYSGRPSHSPSGANTPSFRGVTLSLSVGHGLPSRTKPSASSCGVPYRKSGTDQLERGEGQRQGVSHSARAWSRRVGSRQVGQQKLQRTVCA